MAMLRFLLRDGNIINAPVELDDEEVLHLHLYLVDIRWRDQFLMSKLELVLLHVQLEW